MPVHRLFTEPADRPLTGTVCPCKRVGERFGGLNDDWAEKIIPTADGGYLVAGGSNSGISGDKTAPYKGAIDYWVVKISSNGTKQWDQSFGGNSDDVLASLIQTADGGYLLGGYSTSGISGDKSTANKGSMIMITG